MMGRNFSGPGRNIGHGPANKAEFIENAKVVEMLEAAAAEGCEVIRYNWAFDSMFPMPSSKDESIARTLLIALTCARLGMLAWAVGGSGPYPNQPGWVATAQGASTVKPTWHGALPPRELWPYIVDRSNRVLLAVWRILIEEGFDPREHFALQAHNECADGGVNDPTRPNTLKSKAGTGRLLPGMAAYLEYLALNINTLGMFFIGPGMECEAKTAATEVQDLCSRPWMRRFDVIDVHCYDDTPGTAGDKYRSLRSFVGMQDFVSDRPLWVGETDSDASVQSCLAAGAGCALRY